ncbi:MAG TPA: tyrosine-protein phosphatase [Dehalococcoidia bacterium]|jgi:protein-tyrosine phosphatase
MQTEASPSLRHYTLAGPGNFRDIGGYAVRDGRRTRWRRLFRSDSLHRLTDEDLAELEAQHVHIKLGLDLRTVREVEAGGDSALFSHGARHLHVPFVEAVRREEGVTRFDSVGAMYVDMIERAHEPIRLAFEALADVDNFPAVYYCSAGKDRTGMLTALLLSSLGVSDADIVADYALTDLHMHAVLSARVEKARQDRLEREAEVKARGEAPHEQAAPQGELAPDLLRARPESMVAFLEHLSSRYGSAAGYLAHAGVTRDALERIEELLLE